VVTLPSSSWPWKPATTTICFFFSAWTMRSASMLLMRALEKVLSVVMRTWCPRKLTALRFCAWMASANSPMVTCSPVATTTSCSRSLGRSESAATSLSSRFVSPDMAETTTTTSWPAFWAAMQRRATFLMRSVSPTEVPPYF
jgi:hypothetical protein